MRRGWIVLVVLALAAGATLWFLKSAGSRKEDVQVVSDTALDMSLDGGIKGQKKKATGHGGGGAGGGGFSPGGMSFDQAVAANPQQISIGPQGQRAPDLTNEQLSAPMRNAAFLDACGAPSSMHVTVKAVVKMGHAVGVSVITSPPNGGVASCIDHAVRGIAWPVNAQPDQVITNY